MNTKQPPENTPFIKTLGEQKQDLLEYYIKRCKVLEQDNDRLREELRKYRGY